MRSTAPTRLLAYVFAAGLFVLLVAPMDLAAQVETPARAAVAAAQDLQRKGASPPDIAVAMQRQHRQTPGQTSAILRGLRFDATRTADAVRRTYRTAGDATARALLAGGFERPAAVRGAVANRVDVADVVRGFSSFRIGADETARALADASVPVDRTVTAFRSTGLALESSARAVVGAYPDIRGQVVTTYQAAGYGTPSLLQVLGVLEFSPETVVDEMVAAGEDWESIAEVLDNTFSVSEEETCALLEDSDYPLEDPAIASFRISDYRAMGSGWMESDTPEGVNGIVDPQRSTTVAGDGRVEIRGNGLEGPCLRVYITADGDELPATILSGRDDAITVEFSEVKSGSLRVEHAGGEASRSVRALGYEVYSVGSLIESPSFDFQSGAASMRLGLPELSTVGLTLPELLEDEVRVTSGSATSAVVTAGATAATLRGLPTARLQWSYPVTGMQYVGSVLRRLPYYTCRDFAIPEHQCSSFTAACLSQAFDDVADLGGCANVDAWSVRYLEGPGWPYVAQSGGAEVRVQVALAVVDGRLTATMLSSSGVVPVVDPSVLPTPIPSVPPTLAYLTTGSALSGAIAIGWGPETGFDAVLTDASVPSLIEASLTGHADYLQGGYPGKTLIGVWVRSDGRLLLEFEYPSL